MGGSTSQIANQCCCEQKAVYNVKKGTWTSPFQTTDEYLNVSNIWTKSTSAPPSGIAPAIVLVGGTGVGKSNLGNILLGRSAFESRNSHESVTSVTTWIDGTWFGGRHPVRVVDCTGIGDTKGASADQKQWDTTIEVLKTVGKISALVMVMRAGRFTKFDRDVIATMRKSFGPHFWKNMCVFCTGASAKPGQLNLEAEGPKIRRKLHQIEREQGGDEAALHYIQNMHVYAADLDPVIASSESRSLEFKFKPALSGLNLEDLISLDLRIPPNVMEMSGEEFRKFASADAAIERWIEGNYFQLGLARLAAFKTDVIAMDAFSPGVLARLADAPKDEPPPPDEKAEENLKRASAKPTKGEYLDGDDQRKYFTELDHMELALVGEDVVMIKGSFIERVAAERGILPRSQELPPEALWDPTSLIQGLKRAGDHPLPYLVSVSYCWLSARHPDPDGFQLQILAPLLTAFARWNRTSTSHIAVFLDWCSLPQEPRSTNDAAAWTRAMQHVHLWYAHTTTSVWLLTRVPDGVTPYGARGWPQFEKSISGMVNPSNSVLDMGMLRAAWVSWGQVLQDCKVKPSPPVAPDAFATELLRKAFTEDTDRELLTRRFGEVFRGAVGCAELLQYPALRWSDREAVRIAKLLPLCEACKELELQQNDISDRGAKALQMALSQCPQLERLALWGNCIEQDAQESLLQSWLQAGKSPRGLEMGDQRKPVSQVMVDTSGPSGMANAGPLSPKSPNKGSFPMSPAAARRSADELAALQMAELGARQAAFEARLHVAINRISTTLGEVGDAVGGTPHGSSLGSTPHGSLAGWGMPQLLSPVQPGPLLSPVHPGARGLLASPSARTPPGGYTPERGAG
eukprot:CAMPEP_0203877044 /NCGR_PEP_ID=MMETSP0359-20131031/21705_1 /ASSEMBLY_ACC=CAM_ASM_000338 /TAXON_ID=268821 /ORGANISM="Scrippsiella Hangoei, Strain SHTV-5" /LENGTH=856 /DNA_ID=CAMNT_0050795945 /DNA_START=46 /DNA_END=2616 /DNA_ORIENTATION=-